MFGEFPQVPGQVRAVRTRWVGRLAPNSPDAGINFPTNYMLTDKFDYPDEKIVRGHARGMPIAGHVEAAPGLTPRGKCAHLSYRQWKWESTLVINQFQNGFTNRKARGFRRKNGGANE